MTSPDQMTHAANSSDASQPTVAILGLGYVGLPTALALVDSGCNIIGCDVSEERLAAIKTGRVDLLPDDHARLDRYGTSETFVLTTNFATTTSADVIIVCVPTPVDAHLVPDISALSNACQHVTELARPGQTIVLSSTTYVGCTRQLLIDPLEARGFRVGKDVFVAFSPERIDPGNAAHRQEFVPRVIGGVTAECARRTASIVSRVTPSVHSVSSPEAAEAAKLLENSFRAVNISFVNEFADACGELGLDIIEVIDAAATKPYGFMPFYPGPGVGGHCVPCDPHYLLWQLRAQGSRLPITESAMSAIAARPRQVATRAVEVLAQGGRPMAGARVLVVGVAYKPGVSDLRGSSAIDIIRELRRRGATVDYYDPKVDVVTVDGQPIVGLSQPAEHEHDLAIIHTMHSDVDYTWLGCNTLVLDATYRADEIISRFRL